jgi:hypothetical protein
MQQHHTRILMRLAQDVFSLWAGCGWGARIYIIIGWGKFQDGLDLLVAQALPST